MDIIELIRKEIEANYVKNDEEKVKYIENMLNKYNPADALSLNAFNESEIFALTLLANNLSISLDEVKEASEKVEQFVKATVNDDLSKLFSILYIIYEKKDKDYFKHHDKNSLSTIFCKLKVNTPKYNSFKKLINKYYQRSEEFLFDFLRLIDAKNSQQQINIKINELINNYKKHPKTRNELQKVEINKLKEITNYNEIIGKTHNYLLELKKELNYKRKRRNICDKLLKSLNNNEKFLVINPEWHILSPELQIELIKKVLDEQNFNYNELLEKEKELKKYSEIYRMLFDHGINSNIILEIEKMNPDVKKVNSALKILDESNYPISLINDSNCLFALLTCSKDSLNNLISYYKTGAISIDFFKKNYDQILSNDEIILQNFNLLKDENASFKVETYDANILLLAPDDLKKRINLAKSYGLELNKDENIFNLINNVELFDLIDFALEHHLPIAEVLKVSNNYELFMKRIIILENLGFEILSENNEILYSILNNSSFIISDDDIDEMTINSTPYEERKEMKKKLDESFPIDLGYIDSVIMSLDNEFLTQDNQTYDFDGIIISRNKILRNRFLLKITFPDASEEDILYSSAIHKTILTDDELQSIHKCIYKNKVKNLNL